MTADPSLAARLRDALSDEFIRSFSYDAPKLVRDSLVDVLLPLLLSLQEEQRRESDPPIPQGGERIWFAFDFESELSDVEANGLNDDMPLIVAAMRRERASSSSASASAQKGVIDHEGVS